MYGGWEILEYIRQGGWIMVPLVAVSVVMWTLIVDRLRAFAQLSRRDLDPAAVVAAVLAADNVVLAGRHGLRAVLARRFLAERSGLQQLDREILFGCALHLRRGLENRLALIAVLAGIAPLLGLLGTVLGMIETFDVISIFGTGNARALAGGISVALITTQTGLLVAIPGLLMSNRLTRASQGLQTTLDETTALLARSLSRRGALK